MFFLYFFNFLIFCRLECEDNKWSKEPTKSIFHSSLRNTMWTWTTPFMVFIVTYITMSLTLFWGVSWITLTINNFIISINSWHWVFNVLTNILACVRLMGLWGACMWYTMVYSLNIVYTNNTCHYWICHCYFFFPLDTKTQCYHLTYPNVLLEKSECRYLLT